MISPPPEVPAHTWRPIRGQYYKPAYNSEFFKLCFEEQKTRDQGKVVVALVQLKSEEEMIEADHKVPRMNRILRAGLDSQKGIPAADAVVRDLDLIVNAVKAGSIKEDKAHTEQLVQMGISEEMEVADAGTSSSVDELIANARRQSLAAAPDLSVFMAVGELKTTIITRPEMGEALALVADSTSITQAALNIVNGIEKHSDKPSVVASLQCLADYLTSEVNYIVKVRMGLAGVNIDDILTDMEDLLHGLENEFGKAYYDAFVAHQRTLIETLLGKEAMDSNVISPVSLLPVTQGEEGEGARELPKGFEVTLKRDVAVALLDIDSTCFGVQLQSGESLEIFPSNFPGLHGFVKTCITKVSPGARVYLVTIDGKRYGVDTSIMGDKPALIYAL